MTTPDPHDPHAADPHTADRRLDALLRDLGPDVPKPDLTPAQRAQLAGTLTAIPAARRAPVWPVAAGVLLILGLGLTTLLLGAQLRESGAQLTEARWESDEALELLTRARFGQPTVPVPEDIGDVAAEDLVVVTFDHDLCPIAAKTTPAFAQLAEEPAWDGIGFVVFDVNQAARDGTAAEVESLGIGYGLLTPLGGETGVVKVLDRARGRVLCSAPGEMGIAQAKTLLARVSDMRGLP